MAGGERGTAPKSLSRVLPAHGVAEGAVVTVHPVTARTSGSPCFPGPREAGGQGQGEPVILRLDSSPTWGGEELEAKCNLI